MEHPNRLTAAPIVVGLLLLVATYVGSYVALLNPPAVAIAHPMDGSGHMMFVSARSYSLGGRFAEIVFWPLEQIDMRLRPKVWSPEFME